MHVWSEGCLNPYVFAAAWSGLLLSCCAPCCCSPDLWHILPRMPTSDPSGTWQSTAVRVSPCSKSHRTGSTQPLLALSTLGGRPARCQLVTREAQAVVCSATSVWILLSSCRSRLASLCVSTRSSLRLSPPCSTFQAVVQESLFSDNPIDPLEQTSSKQVASPCPLRGFVIKHAMLSPDITTNS